MVAFSQPKGSPVGEGAGSRRDPATSDADVSSPPKMGGEHRKHRTYTGRVEIITVRPKKLARGHPVPPYEIYEVRFLFFPDQRIKEPYAQVPGKPQLYTLTNSRYHEPQFLRKYDIAEGQTFDCYLKVITRGTCTPVVFEFPDIGRRDYFESRSSQ
jgi:hypothetical protein